MLGPGRLFLCRLLGSSMGGTRGEAARRGSERGPLMGVNFLLKHRGLISRLDLAAFRPLSMPI